MSSRHGSLTQLAKAKASAASLSQLKWSTLSLEEKYQNEKVLDLKSFKNGQLPSHQLTPEQRVEREKALSLDYFYQMLNAFKKIHEEKGIYEISLPEFKEAYRKVAGKTLQEESLEDLFRKIDIDNRGYITWDKLCTFLLSKAEGEKELQEKSDVRVFEKETVGGENYIATPHKDMIIFLGHLPHVRKILLCSRDGTLSIWNEEMKAQRVYQHLGKMSLKNDILFGMKATSPWVLACTFMEKMNKLVVSTDNHLISIIDYGSMLTELVFDTGNDMAFCLQFHEPNLLMYGTEGGSIVLLELDFEELATLKNAKGDNKKALNITAECKSKRYMSLLYKKKLHGDIVTKIAYVQDIHAVISCSADYNASICVTKHDPLMTSWTSFTMPVHKGVNAFEYLHFPPTLIAGGPDRNLRLWNANNLRQSIAVLKGHASPIHKIAVSQSEGLIISLSSDKTIKIWDGHRHNCLQTIFNMTPQRPENLFTAMNFFNSTLFLASSNIIKYKLKPKFDILKSHQHPVRAAFYNSAFGQVVSGCDGGTVNVWDVFTGRRLFQFSNIHGNSEITALAMDPTGRRLATGARDGSIKVWNYNSGQCLYECIKGNTSEVTCISFVDLGESKTFIIAGGWDQKISVFQETKDAVTLSPINVIPTKAKTWHRDDILCVDFIYPNMVVAGSYDGFISFSNLFSGQLIHYAEALDSEQYTVAKMIVLQKRRAHRKAADLITLGYEGRIRWWISNDHRLVWTATIRNKKDELYCMGVNTENTILVTGYSSGAVTVWDISGTCVDASELSKSMTLLSSFHAHSSCVMSIDVLSERQLILTGSRDHTVALFDYGGHCIGMFGQAKEWDLPIESYFEKLGDIEGSNESLGPPLKKEKSLEKLDRRATMIPRKKTLVPPEMKRNKSTMEYNGSWFSHSQYAKDRFRCRHLPQLTLPRIVNPVSGFQSQIYRQLTQYELREIHTDSILPTLAEEQQMVQPPVKRKLKKKPKSPPAAPPPPPTTV